MFNSKDKGANTHYDTLISAKTTIVGDISFTGGLHIDGTVKGNLSADEGSGAVVRISDKGRVEGEVVAPNVIVNGDVSGDIHASSYIELAKKAQVKGDVHYLAMEMVLGAQVNGKLHHQEKGSIKQAPRLSSAEASATRNAAGERSVADVKE